MLRVSPGLDHITTTHSKPIKPCNTPSSTPPLPQSTPRRTNLSTRLTSRHRIRPIRITLPRNSSRRRHYRELVSERHTRRQLDRLLPHRVTSSVARSRQAGSVRRVPAAEFCEAADDSDGVAVVRGALFGEGDGDFGGAC